MGEIKSGTASDFFHFVPTAPKGGDVTSLVVLNMRQVWELIVEWGNGHNYDL